LPAFFIFLSLAAEGIQCGDSAERERREIRCNRSRVISFVGLLISVLAVGAAAQSNQAPKFAFDAHGESSVADFGGDINAYRSDAAGPSAAPPAEGAIHIGMPAESVPNLFDFRLLAEPYIAARPLPKPRFELKNALRQEFQYLMVEHAFRLAQDESLRSQLLHGPFFRNWFRSFQGYDLKRWGDGDDFLVNDIAHPMQGAVASWIFIQNSPVARTRVIGKDPQYWTSRLKGMAWATAFEIQWKIGPLSETSIGNAGGWSYVPDCGIVPRCINNPHYPPPTNNTGLSDWIVTPLVGTGWVMIEDTIDRFVVGKAAEHSLLYAMILRSALEPTRNFAALFTGVLPWDPAFRERLYVRPKFPYAESYATEAPWKKNRGAAGFHFVNVSLPGASSDCVGCRENNPGIGFPFGYRIFEHTHFDGEINYFPSEMHAGAPSVEGLFGAKVGLQGQKWGMFGKVRPGFIYYRNAWSGGQTAHFKDLSRFALDMGGAFEVYPSRRSTLRFDFGSTLVRYLQDYPNPHISPIGSLISTDYYVTQGNFQMSAGYRVRF
jgi:hypothetical protein